VKGIVLYHEKEKHLYVCFKTALLSALVLSILYSSNRFIDKTMQRPDKVKMISQWTTTPLFPGPFSVLGGYQHGYQQILLNKLTDYSPQL